MKNVTIIGVGLIGGSLGLALRAARKRSAAGYHVTGIGRNKKKLAHARRLGAVDEYTTNMIRGVKDADIVVIGTPVDLIASTVEAIAPSLKPGAIVTDVGSVKGVVVRGVQRVLARLLFLESRPVFIGGHPLAGSEKTGVRFASSDLYRDAAVVLTPGPGTPRKALSALRDLWRDAGAKVLCMTPLEHDRIVATTSHLLHILAFSVCGAVTELNRKHPSTSSLLAGSFRDVTRIADSNAHDWAAICYNNKEELAGAIDMFVKKILKIRSHLDDVRYLNKVFLAAKEARQKLLHIK